MAIEWQPMKRKYLGQAGYDWPCVTLSVNVKGVANLVFSAKATELMGYTENGRADVVFTDTYVGFRPSPNGTWGVNFKRGNGRMSIAASNARELGLSPGYKARFYLTQDADDPGVYFIDMDDPRDREGRPE